MDNKLTDNKTDMASATLERAFDEIRLLGIPIDGIVQGYIDYWQELDNNLEDWMDFQKRIYILTIRHLPSSTHRDLYLQVIKEYRNLLAENKRVLEDLKIRRNLEKKDIDLFDKWIVVEKNILDVTRQVPILKEYKQYMKNILPIGEYCSVEDITKQKEDTIDEK